MSSRCSPTIKYMYVSLELDLVPGGCEVAHTDNGFHYTLYCVSCECDNEFELINLIKRHIENTIKYLQNNIVF